MGHQALTGETLYDKRAFYLVLMNRTQTARKLKVTGLNADYSPSSRLKVKTPAVVVGPNRNRRVLVFVDGLVPGERLEQLACVSEKKNKAFRVCTQLKVVRHDRLPGRGASHSGQ